MGGDVQGYAANCQSCLSTMSTQYRPCCQLRLFLTTEPLAFVTLDILGPSPKSESDHYHVLVITDRCTTLTRTITLKSTISQAVTDFFLTYCTYAYGFPDLMMSNNGSQLITRYFQHEMAILNIKHAPTSRYHPKTNGQIERYNSSLVTQLCHYVAEHQRNWDAFLQPLIYAYNAQVHRSIKCK